MRRRSTRLEYNPFLFPSPPALQHCRSGTYNKYHNVYPPAAGAEKHGTHSQSSDRQSTPVSLFTLQATWLTGHSVVTNRGARGSDCICVVNFTYNILIRKKLKFYCILKYKYIAYLCGFPWLSPSFGMTYALQSLSLLTANQPVGVISAATRTRTLFPPATCAPHCIVFLILSIIYNYIFSYNYIISRW